MKLICGLGVLLSSSSFDYDALMAMVENYKVTPYRPTCAVSEAQC